MAEKRAAAAALAMRLYRVDHNQWPASLEALVPAYLPAIPNDPMSPGNRPIGYVILRGALPGGGDRPLLVFNASDPASPGTPPAEPAFGWQSPRFSAQWRDLSRWAPAPPSTAPAAGPQ
jgi:hypothetical protein